MGVRWGGEVTAGSADQWERPGTWKLSRGGPRGRAQSFSFGRKITDCRTRTTR